MLLKEVRIGRLVEESCTSVDCNNHYFTEVFGLSEEKKLRLDFDFQMELLRELSFSSG